MIPFIKSEIGFRGTVSFFKALTLSFFFTVLTSLFACVGRVSTAPTHLTGVSRMPGELGLGELM